VNPLGAHWLRMTVWLLLASPLVALLVMWTADADFTFALIITLYIWAVVVALLAIVAFAGLLVRLLGRGIRALRR
jgi:hypothetical protein